MTWGTGSWGTGPWGTGSASDLYIVSAFPTSTRTVVVELSRPPLQESPIGSGDALNPASWTVTNEGTDEDLLVLATRLYNATYIFELYTLYEFGDHLTVHKVEALTLKDQLGNTIISPRSANFSGCIYAAPAETEESLVDLVNHQVSAGEISGTLVVGSDGDYVGESGAALLRKLVFRRLTTRKGEFFHYNPNYGLGINMKEPLTFTDLPRLKAEVERQVAQEPEFDQVQARVSLTENTIVIQIKARVRSTNREVVQSFTVPNIARF